VKTSDIRKLQAVVRWDATNGNATETNVEKINRAKAAKKAGFSSSLDAILLTQSVDPSGNWNGPKDWFPRVTINQETGDVTITRFYTSGHQKKATVSSFVAVYQSPDGQALGIIADVSVKNWINYKTSGDQSCVFIIFRGDSGHFYTHRPPATESWKDVARRADLAEITKRLRKLGIGANAGVVQQGDFLLKPANGNAYGVDAFKHETMGAGHHKFAAPVLYSDGASGRQYRITEPILLQHEAVDGIKHPDVTVPVGIWTVGTTAASLPHHNQRD